jgi:hypothetical protein
MRAAGAETDDWIADASVRLGIIASTCMEGPFPCKLHDTPNGCYYSLGDDNNVFRKANFPIQPKADRRFDDELGDVHGLLFEGGHYTETTGFDPVISAAVDINATGPIPEPEFSAQGWYPTLPATLNRVRFLDGSLAWKVSRLTGQYRASDQKERLFDYITYTLYYNNDATDFDAPEITTVGGWETLQGVVVTATVSDASGAWRVVATWTSGDGHWRSEDLEWDDGEGEWRGTLPTVEPAEYMVQAVDAAGNVGVDDHEGLYYQALLGDIDGDCDVDIMDIMQVASRWNSSGGDPDYNPRYDFDGDGDIDIVDIMNVAARWGDTC